MFGFIPLGGIPQMSAVPKNREFGMFTESLIAQTSSITDYSQAQEKLDVPQILISNDQSIFCAVLN